jgi:hypothetical protein
MPASVIQFMPKQLLAEGSSPLNRAPIFRTGLGAIWKPCVPLTNAAAVPLKSPWVTNAARGYLLRGLSDAGRAVEEPRASIRPPSETHYASGNDRYFNRTPLPLRKRTRDFEFEDCRGSVLLILKGLNRRISSYRPFTWRLF